MNARFGLLVPLFAMAACVAGEPEAGPVLDAAAVGKADGFETPRFEVPGRGVARINVSSTSGSIAAQVVDTSPAEPSAVSIYALAADQECADAIGDQGQTLLTPVAQSDAVVDPGVSHDPQTPEPTAYCVVVDNEQSIPLSMALQVDTTAPEPAGDCCETGEAAGCADTTCEAAVCDLDPFCCETQWDDLCAEQAEESCEVCGAEEGPLAASVFEVQDGTVGVGTEVLLEGLIVTGIRSGVGLFAQDPAGGAHSGIFVDAGEIDVTALAVGDVVDVTGRVLEEAVGPLADLTQIDAGVAGSIVDTGMDGSASAATVSLAELAEPETAEAFEGVLVTVVDEAGLAVVSENQFQEFEIGDGTHSVWVDDFLFDAYSDEATFPNLAVGATFGSITGPLNYTFGAFKIAPRSAEDLSGHGDGAAGACCEDHGGMGCSDATCEATVCEADPFCCDTAWDSFCAQDAVASCTELCG